jgi:hypothetical protein
MLGPGSVSSVPGAQVLEHACQFRGPLQEAEGGCKHVRQLLSLFMDIGLEQWSQSRIEFKQAAVKNEGGHVGLPVDGCEGFSDEMNLCRVHGIN